MILEEIKFDLNQNFQGYLIFFFSQWYSNIISKLNKYPKPLESPCLQVCHFFQKSSTLGILCQGHFTFLRCVVPLNHTLSLFPFIRYAVFFFFLFFLGGIIMLFFISSYKTWKKFSFFIIFLYLPSWMQWIILLLVRKESAFFFTTLNLLRLASRKLKPLF